jgi:hypothetical protein
MSANLRRLTSVGSLAFWRGTPSTCVWDSNHLLASNRLIARGLGTSILISGELSWPGRSIQNSKNSRTLARLWWVNSPAERVGFGLPGHPLDSVSCRFHNARVAVDASDALAPCPPLPARMSRRMGCLCLKSAGSRHHHSDVHGSWRDTSHAALPRVLSRTYRRVQHRSSRTDSRRTAARAATPRRGLGGAPPDGTRRGLGTPSGWSSRPADCAATIET